MAWSTILKNRQQIRARIDAGEEITVMFSDIRGFTAYTAREGDRAAYHLSQLHRSLLKGRIEGEGGILVKTLGDGIMAAFPGSSGGIRAAVAIQRAIRSHNKTSAKEPIDVGIGVASGTPVMVEDDLIGHSVNLAQRLSGLAKGGQILVTEAIKKSTLLAEGMHYLPLGARALKGMESEPVYEVAWMAEVARLSDAENRMTLVLTEHGTLVLKLAKDLQQQVPARLARLGAAEEEDSFSALLERGIAHFTRQIIDKSLGAFGIAREHNLEKVAFSLQGKDLLVRLGERDLRLRGVDPTAARAFLGKLDEIKEKSAKPAHASEGEIRGRGEGGTRGG